MSNAKSSDFMDFYLDVEEMGQQDDQSDQIFESENKVTRYLRGAKVCVKIMTLKRFSTIQF